MTKKAIISLLIVLGLAVLAGLLEWYLDEK